VTLSIGVACSGDGEGLLPLMARADLALYDAKRSGRACVREFAAGGNVRSSVCRPDGTVRGTMWRLSRLSRSRPPALLLGLLAALCCAAALAGPSPGAHARPFDRNEVSARRAPVFGLVPISRREEAVLRSQPDLQLLGLGTPAGGSKLARLKVARNRRPVAGPARRGAGG